MSIKGFPEISFAWSVPADKAAEVDEIVCAHTDWINATHTSNPDDGDDSVKPRMHTFYWTKGPEMKNPLAPEEGPTGNTLFVLIEIYYAPTGIARHLELAKAWDRFPRFLEVNATYGKFLNLGTSTVLKTMTDSAYPFRPALGNFGIQIVFNVPNDKAAEFDAFPSQHEPFMRSTHELTMGEGNDAERPRITSYNWTKGPEMKNPLDPSEGETGNTVYLLTETYLTPAGVQAHFAVAKKEVPELYGIFEQHVANYMKFATVGTGEVYKTFA